MYEQWDTHLLHMVQRHCWCSNGLCRVEQREPRREIDIVITNVADVNHTLHIDEIHQYIIDCVAS